jgi:serine protease Do
VIADVAREFVLVRLTSMRGVDLDVFDFDYDLTWAAFFLDANERVLGRYGGRDALSPDKRTSLAGLRCAMVNALKTHRDTTSARSASESNCGGGPSLALRASIGSTDQRVHSADQYPAARRRPANSCIHCHHVYDFRREALQAQGKWSKDQLWVYPLPENVGVTLEVDEDEHLKAVAAGSPADRAGLRAGDRLQRINGIGIASTADVQYALHCAPGTGEIPISWRRGGAVMTARLGLTEGWKQTDISWRWSLRGLEPTPWVDGEDLSLEEKRRLGLPEKRLAFYQSAFVSTVARQAGIRANDVIIGIDGKRLEMSELQFAAYVKLNYKAGDRVTYNLFRAGKPIDIPITLVRRPLS